MPAINDPIRIPIFAEFVSKGLSANARFEIKIDIVNPTPARNAIPKMCATDIPLGSSANLSLTPKNVNRGIPINFPRNRPAAIAIAMFQFIPTSKLNTTPAFARAKTGMIK